LVCPPPAASTITVGLATLDGHGTLEDLIAEADRDMYRHKPPRPSAEPPGP
jgi:PleD family two-component response regulator